MGQSMKDAAKVFAANGIPVFPLHTPRTDGSCSCGKEGCERVGKHPRADKDLLPHGVKNASTDLDTIEKWWDKWPRANIGLATGAASGIEVVDLDGEEGLQSIREVLGQDVLDSTLAATTGNGGIHLYFRGAGIGNKVGLLPGVDIRSDDGHVVAPPSLHYSGAQYKWLNEFSIKKLPPVPRGIIEAIQERSADVIGKLEQDDWSRLLGEGERNKELARRAGKLLRSDIPPQIVLKTLSALNEEYCHPPLPEQELVKMVNSLGRKERLRRETEAKRETQDPGSAGFPVLTFAESLRKYGGFELQWDVPGWLPRNTVGLVVAPPGTYKTWILADLCTAYVGARKFLGKYAIDNPRPVVLIQQEDYLPALLERICTMLTNHQPKSEKYEDDYEFNLYSNDLPIYIHERRAFHLANKEGMKHFEEMLKTVRPGLVIIDPLYSAVGMNDYMVEAAQQMLVLKQFRDTYNCTFMIAHHTNKGAGKDEQGRKRDEAWGSQFLNAWLETGWQLRTGTKNGEVNLTRHFKVSENPPEIKMQFHITDHTYEVEFVGEMPENVRVIGKSDPPEKIFKIDQLKPDHKAVAQGLGFADPATVFKLYKEVHGR